MRVPAVVGSFPEPFVLRQRGPQAPGPARLPRRRRRRLRRGRDAAARRGHRPTRRAPCSSSPPGARCCGCSSARGRRCGATPPRASSRAGPASSGVFARPTQAGDRIDLLDAARAHRARRSAPGGGLLAATRIEAQQPTWIVTGVDAAGVAASAAALTEQELQRPLRDRRRGGPHGAAAGGRPGAGRRDLRAARRARCTRRAPGSARPGASTLGLVALSTEQPRRARRAAGERARRGGRRPRGAPRRARRSPGACRSRW